MTDAGPTPSAPPTSTSPGAGVPSSTPSEVTTTSRVSPSGTSGREALAHTRTSGIWAAVVALVVLLVLLAIFVLQNVQQVEVSYLGWQGRAPLASALLIATASGALIAVIAGTLRILQLRRRVRRAQKH